MVLSNEQDPCVIRIKNGLVQGRRVGNVLGGTYFSFQGMRYAKPPLGRLRFKAPEEEEPWEGIYDATKEGSICTSPTPQGDKIIGTEDCLFINVFTNTLPTPDSPPKAVMFWIYGGGWNLGSGGTELFGPDYLLTGDVVLVTFNYRLGLLGFANFEDPEIDVPGNALFKDIVRALEWVQQNIKYFNGDPNNVTIFGESRGALAIHIISHSEQVKGLYHKEILMSSSSCYRLDDQAYSRKTKEFSKILGLESENEREIYEFLLEQPAEKLVEAGQKFLELNDNRFYRTFCPVLETPAKSERRLITEPIEKYLLERHPNPKPTIFGSVSADGMFHASETYMDGFLSPHCQKFENYVPLDILTKLNISRDSDQAKEIGNEIKEYYYGDQTPSFRCLNEFVELQTDVKYRLTGKMVANSMLKFQPDYPLYMYKFSVDSPHNIYRKFHGLQNLRGACHGDDLTYLFHTRFTHPFRKGTLEDKTLKRMVSFWTNFAKYGDPNPQTPHPDINIAWEPAREGVLNHLDIGRNLKMVNEQPEAKRMRFWDNLYERLGITID